MNWTKEIIKITGLENSLVSNGDGSAYDWIELKIKDTKQLSKVLKFANDTSLKIITKPKDEVESTVHNWISKHPEETVAFVFLDLTELNKIIEHVESDQVISVQTGIKIDQLNQHLSKTNQWLPATGTCNNSTILDLIETGSGGLLDTAYGGGRNLVLGLETTLADGTEIRSGGKIVKNVTGYDMTKLLVGSNSWFGVSHTAHLRLFAKPEKINTFVISLDAENEIEKIVTTIFDSGAPLAALNVTDKNIASLLADQSNHLQYQKLWKKIEEEKRDSVSFAIISFAGNKKEVEECDHLIESITKNPYLKFGDNGGDDLIQSLSQVETLLNKKSIEISSSIKESYRIYNAIDELDHALNWIYFPVTGRLSVLFDDQKISNPEPLQEKLSNCLTGDRPVSTATNSTMKSVYQNDSENAKNLKRIKYDLKAKFDKNNILNPLVQF